MRYFLNVIQKHPFWTLTISVLIVGGLLLCLPLPSSELKIMILVGLVLILMIGYIIIQILTPKKTPSEAAENGSVNLIKELNQIKEQLLIQDKMASVGMLTAGIAHEIKNPLNFVNNFSEMAVGLLQDLKEELDTCDIKKEKIDNIHDVMKDLEDNLSKINQHGKRAESIVKHMLMQAHTEELTKVKTNINDLVDEYLHLAYHGMRAQNPEFNVSLKTDFDKTLPKINISQQNVGRVFLNIINNGLYAAYEKKQTAPEGFMPTIEVKTEKIENGIKIIIKDNGSGIPEKLQQRIFEPFFTTKPIGVGTGLGLHICNDIIVKQHSGHITIDTKKGEYTAFIITLPQEVEQKK